MPRYAVRIREARHYYGLARRPRLLLLDEPTNHLDVDAFVWLEAVLRAAVGAGLVGAVVAVSHDRTFLNRACTHTVDATGGGGVLYRGGYNDFLAARGARRSALESLDDESALKAEPSRSPKKTPTRFRLASTVDGKATVGAAGGGGVAAGKAAPAAEVAPAAAEATAAAPPLLWIENGAVRPYATSRTPSVTAATATTAAEAEGAAVEGAAVEGGALLESVSLRLHRGECLLVIGPNGVGKSSLLHAAAGGAALPTVRASFTFGRRRQMRCRERRRRWRRCGVPAAASRPA